MNKAEVKKALSNINDDETRVKYIDSLLKNEAESTLAYLGFIKMIIKHNKVDPLDSIMTYIQGAENETKARNGIKD